MSHLEVIHAWKDALYRQSLSQEQQALLPQHPAGSIELSDEQLHQIAGLGPHDSCVPVCRTTQRPAADVD